MPRKSPGELATYVVFTAESTRQAGLIAESMRRKRHADYAKLNMRVLGRKMTLEMSLGTLEDAMNISGWIEGLLAGFHLAAESDRAEEEELEQEELELEEEDEEEEEELELEVERVAGLLGPKIIVVGP